MCGDAPPFLGRFATFALKVYTGHLRVAAMAVRRGVAYMWPMILTRIDRWIGTTLFVPLIVKLCQRTGQTQYAVSRLFWFLAALDGFYHADTLVSGLMFGAMSVFMMVTGSLRADWPTRSSMLFRILAVAFLALDVMGGVAKGEWAGVEFWVIVLVAEYAASIRTIPPASTKKKVEAAKSSTI